MVLICSFASLLAQEPSTDVAQILKLYPGYHLLELQERDSETRAFIVRHYPKDDSSVVHADFDGDGNPDYALLLESEKTRSAKLVILLCSGHRACRSVFEDEISNDVSYVYIRPVPVGSRVSQTDAVDTEDHSSSVTLKSTGIRLTYFGQADVVYYWSRRLKKIEKVQTAD